MSSVDLCNVILNSSMYKNNEKFSLSDVYRIAQNSRRSRKVSKEQCNDAIKTLLHEQAIDHCGAGYKANSEATKLIRKSWRLNTNEQLGIEECPI